MILVLNPNYGTPLCIQSYLHCSWCYSWSATWPEVGWFSGSYDLYSLFWHGSNWLFSLARCHKFSHVGLLHVERWKKYIALVFVFGEKYIALVMCEFTKQTKCYLLLLKFLVTAAWPIFCLILWTVSVAFKLSKRKIDDNLQLLHTILFGKKAKVNFWLNFLFSDFRCFALILSGSFFQLKKNNIVVCFNWLCSCAGS